MDTIKRNINVPHLSSAVDVEIYINSEPRYGSGYTEDGEREIVNVYFIELQTKDGARYFNEEMSDDLPTIESTFKDIVTQLDAEDGLDWGFWKEGNAVYGSERYMNAGTEYKTMEMEARKEEDDMYM